MIPSPLAALFLLLPVPAQADGSIPAEIPQQGGLRAKDRSGKYLSPFVLERTGVEAEISGPIVSVEVEQVFANPYEGRVEAVYVFPLPENAAVTDMYLRVGDRVIASEVREREEAKKVYEQAKSEGRTAGLLEQERPNIFTQSVANIPPGERVFVRIRYQHELRFDDGTYRFVFPMTVGPRFIPGAPVPGPDRGAGWSPDTAKVPDASRISPHPLRPGERSGHDISLSVSLEGGLPLDSVGSPSHQTEIVRPSRRRAKVRLSPKDSIPNKDFILEFALQGREPEAAVLTHRDGDQGYLMLLLQPQARFTPEQVTAKELVFVVDCSGSMGGEPIAKAKQAMRAAVAGMNPGDSFQIIRFSERASSLSDAPLPNTPENVRRGLSFINNLNGNGGTMMIEGIKAALDMPRDPRRRRMVLFMTDGYIGNEDEILGAINERLGDTRLYSFGVGSSVNRFLLERMAEAGRGFVQYVRPDEDTARAVGLFYKRIANPLLMDISLDWGGLPVEEVYPSAVPDLFSSQPLFVFAKYARPRTGTLRISGSIGGRPYRREVRVILPPVRKRNAALGPLWARKQIKWMMDAMRRGEVPELVSRIVALAKRFKLMSRYTSFVAVERRLRAGTDLPLTTVLVPNEMPEGVSFDSVFGQGSATVSIPRMKPGDPVLSVDAPADAAAVIADFPFGERKLCRKDHGSERWECRFLVPRGVADGRYPIRILIVSASGRQRRLLARYTVDSKAPVLEVDARMEDGRMVFLARPKRHVLELRPSDAGTRVEVHDVRSLRLLGPDGAVLPLRLLDREGEFRWKASVAMERYGPGRHRFIAEAVDFAGNAHRQEVTAVFP